MSHKKDFPIFTTHPELVYLDSTATAHKPQSVIDAVSDFYSTTNANVHRGMYALSEDATALYEGAREKVRAFINAASVKEVVFTKGTTDSINLIARSFSAKKVLITSAEHHSNIVPWQLTNKEIGIVKYDSDFRLGVDDLQSKLDQGVDLVAITHASNVLGTINPIKEIIERAHASGAKVLIDGAQAAPHIPIDVQELDADFYVFSAHKMCGPTGAGVLYAKEALLETMDPHVGGGDMIQSVGFEQSTWNELPWKFEAGTPNVAGVIGFGAAVDYINSIGWENIMKHEAALTKYALEKLMLVPGINLFGPKTPTERLGVFSFSLEGMHPHDVASLLNEQAIAVRAGNHCAMPLHTDVFKVPATTRASVYLYNRKEDIDKLVDGLQAVIKTLKK